MAARLGPSQKTNKKKITSFEMKFYRRYSEFHGLWKKIKASVLEQLGDDTTPQSHGTIINSRTFTVQNLVVSMSRRMVKLK